MGVDTNLNKASYEMDAYTSEVLDRVIEWIQKNKYMYSASGIAAKNAFDGIMKFDVVSNNFKARYNILYKFYENTKKNYLLHFRAGGSNKDLISPLRIDGYFVSETLFYGGNKYNIPIPIGFFRGVDGNDTYYKTRKTLFLKACYNWYIKQFNSQYEGVIDETSSKIQKTGNYGFRKWFGHMATLLILGLGFFTIYQGLKYFINYLIPFFKADFLKEAFLSGENWYHGIAYAFEGVTGLDHGSFISLFICGLILVLFTELLILIFSLKSGFSDFGIYCAERNLSKIYKIIQRERALKPESFEIERRRHNISRLMKLNTHRAGEKKNGYFKRIVNMFLVLLCIGGLNSFSTDAQPFYNYEKKARDYIETIKLEAVALCVADTDVTVYEKPDENSVVQGVVRKGQAYTLLSELVGEEAFLRVKYANDYGYSIGWISTANHNWAAPYEYSDYIKYSIEGISAASYPDDKPLNAPEKMIDNRLETAWCHSEKIAWYNEQITLTIPRDEEGGAKEISVIGIAPGRCQGKTAFENTGRPKKMTLSLYDDKFCQNVTFEIEDGAYFQYYILNRPVKADRIEIKFDAVTYGNSDNMMYVSELSVYGKKKDSQGSVN